MKFTKAQIAVAVAVVVVVAAGSFGSGVAYAKHGNGGRGGFAAGTMERGGFGVGQMAAGRTEGGTGRGMMGGQGIVSGTILSKDADSITVSLQDGGSQVVFLSDKTSVLKSAEGSAADLSAGVNVMVTGTRAADGTLSASSVQVRPAGAAVPAAAGGQR